MSHTILNVTAIYYYFCLFHLYSILYFHIMQCLCSKEGKRFSFLFFSLAQEKHAAAFASRISRVSSRTGGSGWRITSEFSSSESSAVFFPSLCLSCKCSTSVFLSLWFFHSDFINGSHDPCILYIFHCLAAKSVSHFLST